MTSAMSLVIPSELTRRLSWIAYLKAISTYNTFQQPTEGEQRFVLTVWLRSGQYWWRHHWVSGQSVVSQPRNWFPRRLECLLRDTRCPLDGPRMASRWSRSAINYINPAKSAHAIDAGDTRTGCVTSHLCEMIDQCLSDFRDWKKNTNFWFEIPKSLFIMTYLFLYVLILKDHIMDPYILQTRIQVPEPRTELIKKMTAK